MTEITKNYCLRHPKTETNLRCGRCNELICSECLVHTPVGVRCPQCAQQSRVPTYNVTSSYVARAIAAGLAVAVAGGFIMGIFMDALTSLRFLDTVMFIALSYAIGESVSIAANRKRGRRLQLIAASSSFLAFVVIVLVSRSFSSGEAVPVPNAIALIVGFYVAFWKVGR